MASLMDVGEGPSAAMIYTVDNNIENNNNNNIIVENDNNIMDTKPSNDNELAKRYRGGSSNSTRAAGGLINGLCQKNDGKGWQCKREAKEGYSFCEHHLALLRSYNNTGNNNYDSNTSSKSKLVAMEGNGPRRTRGRSAASKKGSAPTNPYEFYYYSGFGPLWGRKRGERAEIKAAAADTAAATTAAETSSGQSTPSPSSNTTMRTSALIDNEEFDYVDDEDEDDDVGSGDSGKKRMRKPVKARSLKSLM